MEQPPASPIFDHPLSTDDQELQTLNKSEWRDRRPTSNTEAEWRENSAPLHVYSDSLATSRPAGSTSFLEKRRKARSYESLTTRQTIDGQWNLPYDSSSLPSTRLANSVAFSPNSEETPLLNIKDGSSRQEENNGKDGKEMVSFSSSTTSTGSIKKLSLRGIFKQSKIAILFLLMLSAVVLFAVLEKEDEDTRIEVVGAGKETSVVPYNRNHPHYRILLTVTGPFTGRHGGNICNSSTDMTVCGDFRKDGKNSSICYCLFTTTDGHQDGVELEFKFGGGVDDLNFTYSSKSAAALPFTTSFEGFTVSLEVQVILAGLILLFVYVLIVFDLVHRVVATMIGSTIAMATQTAVGQRPSVIDIIDHIQFDTIFLLFGMMILVAVFSQTGFFDYAAVKMYKLARGNAWLLVYLLCLFSGVVSAFIDNVTTILLLTPVSIRLCQVLNLDPRYVLIAEVIFSNIGGTATAVGDPPNIIIISHSEIKNETNFLEFTLHLVGAIFFCMLFGFVMIRLLYCNLNLRNKDQPEVAELKRELAIWRRTARYMKVVSLEERAVREALIKKAEEVRTQLRHEISHSTQTNALLWKENLASLESKFRITDRVLLAKSGIVLVCVILAFFLLHTIPSIHLDLGWIAIFGCLVLLILADIDELETVLEKVEWATLLFFAALFILMEILGELGLISYIAEKTVELIGRVDPSNQLLVAILVIVWVSAIASSFIDNIPFTTAMIPVILDLANDESICVPLKPLVWSLALGACLGGNGTLIGASANVVCAGLAEQSGYPISFWNFFKVGFPMMLGTTFVASVYLVICHVVLDWNVPSDLVSQCINTTQT